MTQLPSPRLVWMSQFDAFPATHQALTEDAGANGLLAVSQDLSAAMLRRAYRQGIFPWSGPGEPVMWWAPDPRMVLFVAEFKLHRSIRQAIRKAIADGYEVRCDTAFGAVMAACAAPRIGQNGSWITQAVRHGYEDLHAQGFAHSIELWKENTLWGGLYLVAMGQMIFGESMFSKTQNASKICLATLVKWLSHQTHTDPAYPMLIDCQQETSHLKSLGARPIARAEFEVMMTAQMQKPELPWHTRPPNLDLFQDSHG